MGQLTTQANKMVDQAYSAIMRSTEGPNTLALRPTA
jgi:hypothetical protein